QPGLKRLGGVQHRLGVSGHLHLSPDALDDAVLDQEGRAVDAHIFAAIELLLDPAFVALDHRALGIGAQGDREAVLVGELLVALHAVLGDPDDADAGLGELRRQRAEVLALHGAAGRVVLRVEVEHQRLALEVGETDRPRGAFQLEVRRGRALGHLAHVALLQTGFTRTIFFLPAASFNTPSTRSASLTVRLASVSALSLTRSPPPWARRRASPREAARPASAARAASTIPADSSAAGTSWVGRSSESRPCSNAASAAAAALAASASPCSRAVVALASTFLASLIWAPGRASSSAISSSGRSVNSRRNRPTSASSVFRQNCQ